MSVWDRQCSLVFDEISLKSELTYNKYFDRIIGFTENGHVGTYALVFMVRGLNSKWKQAIAFVFTHNTVATSLLAVLVQQCIDKLEAVGLGVRCIVCDQGATNVAALKVLGYSVEKPSITVSNVGHKIHVIFNVPHTLKNVRNNMQKYDIQF